MDRSSIPHVTSSAVNNNNQGNNGNNTALSIDISNIDANTKAYIDAACQASSNAIICTIKSYINQTTTTQMDLISKMNKRLDTFITQQQKQNPNSTKTGKPGQHHQQKSQS
ncbi:26295_t:CDS:1 [Racocetra persica]|uniref:26295_t:CDS:1 n=1 Tax=Racocetra persica TaxID=160502 RepID=A0ACA9PE22_9GLOM|nr:26295_t:CDS:1 [Racocetra persica]